MSMEQTHLIALARILPIQNAEARSALPGAPVVEDRRRARAAQLPRTRARLATALHRAARALEEGLDLPEGRSTIPRKHVVCRSSPFEWCI